MQVHHSIEALPRFNKAVVTIGTFDGVHLGHHVILDQLLTAAAACGGETVIITFHPHPRAVVQPDRPIFLLTSLEEKVALLEAKGIDHLVVVPFTAQFASLTAQAYVEDFLWKYFHPHTLIIGYDHRFGQGRQGNYEVMEQYAPKLGFQLIEIPAQMIQAATVSSTRIRAALSAGDPQLAAQLLGYAYRFTGTVVKGNQLGRTLGYPTANLQMLETEKLVPANGVYAVTLVVDDQPNQVWQGMMNIGVRPTVDGQHRVVEVHIFEFDREIYGAKLRVSVHAHLRAEMKFPGLDALKAQLAADRISAQQILSDEHLS